MSTYQVVACTPNHHLAPSLKEVGLAEYKVWLRRNHLFEENVEEFAHIVHCNWKHRESTGFMDDFGSFRYYMPVSIW